MRNKSAVDQAPNRRYAVKDNGRPEQAGAECMGEPPVPNGAIQRYVEGRMRDQATRNGHERGDKQTEYNGHVHGLRDRNVRDREADPRPIGPGHERHFGQTHARER